MSQTIDRSQSVFAAANEIIPGGVNSPVRAYRSVGGTPRHMQSGRGAYLTDLDGNEYVDMVLAYGPLILGHANEEVLAALRTQMELGTTFGAPTEGELELARQIIDRFGPVDVVRLVNSGTEATMSALRLARAGSLRDLLRAIAESNDVVGLRTEETTLHETYLERVGGDRAEPS